MNYTTLKTKSAKDKLITLHSIYYYNYIKHITRLKLIHHIKYNIEPDEPYKILKLLNNK